MSDLNLYYKVISLPESLKAEIIDYIDYIANRRIKQKKEKAMHPTAGCMKGTFIMGKDFDEPLDDFKEYTE